MEFFEHPSCNAAFTPSVGTEDKCGTLHVQRWIDPDFGPAMTSYWRPTAEELAALNVGSAVALTIFATGHPVVSMEVTAP